MNPLSTKTEADLMAIREYCHEVYNLLYAHNINNATLYGNIRDACSIELNRRVLELSKQLNTETNG